MCYVFYIDWVGLFNSIAAYPYLAVQWKLFVNQWAEASKTEIIDCFQTPAGSGITNQNSSQGCLELVLQILEPHVQSEQRKIAIPKSIAGSTACTLILRVFFSVLTLILIYTSMLMASKELPRLTESQSVSFYLDLSGGV